MRWEALGHSALLHVQAHLPKPGHLWLSLSKISAGKVQHLAETSPRK